MILLAQKQNTKVILKGMNANVRRILAELGILQKIGQENIADNFNVALNLAIDSVAERFLGMSNGGQQAEFPSTSPAQS